MENNNENKQNAAINNNLHNSEFDRLEDTTNDNLTDGLQPRPLSPEEDPAIINPEELATFPKPAERDENVDIEAEKETRLVNKRSPLREGRNIISTDNNPDRDGFM